MCAPAAIQARLLEALRSIVDLYGADGGALFIGRPGGEPELRVVENLSADCLAGLEKKLGGAASMLAAGSGSGSAEGEVQLLDGLQLTPIPGPAGLQGILLLRGGWAGGEDAGDLIELTRPIGRAIEIHRQYSRAAAPEGSRELAALHSIAAALTSTHQSDEILASALEGMYHVLDVEAASLFLVDAQRPNLLFRRSIGAGSADRLTPISLTGEAGVVRACLDGGRAIRIADVTAEPRFRPEADSVEGLTARSILCAPLSVKDDRLGVIELLNKRDGDFDANDEELLLSMAASAANGVYNARLLQQLTVATADLEASRWEVLRSRSTLQALFDGITAPIYIVDREFILIAANQACARRAGQEPFALLGRRCYEAMRGSNQVCPGCRVLDTLYGGRSTHRTERTWTSGDEGQEWEINTYPILGPRREPIQSIVFNQDVTEKRRLEASLAQSEKLAAVGQLAAGVAHEINNPLAAIIANTQILQRQKSADEAVRESLELIAMAGDRAQRVVRNLLDLSRQERYEFAPVDLNDSVRNAATLIHHQLLERRMDLVLDLDPELPRAEASRDHLQGVWLNLLRNACDAATDEGGEVRVVTRRRGESAEVRFSDSGVGIPADRLSRIFEPFFTTKAPGQGTGLGLSACHRIVKAHAGRISVESQPGSGTVFTVLLPLRQNASL